MFFVYFLLWLLCFLHHVVGDCFFVSESVGGECEWDLFHV